MNYTKIKMGRALHALNGEELRLDGSFGMDARTVAVMVSEVIGKAGLAQDDINKLADRLNVVAGRPLILAEAVCTALLGAYEDEKTLPGSERSKRIAMALRLNRTGMAKISDADIKVIMPLVEKCYRGSLVAPQVEALLRGQPFTTGLVDGDEVDEPAAVT